VTVLLLAGVSFILSWVLTSVVRRYALAHSVLDVPNARSSHSVPTPRGGGLAIAVALLLGVAGGMVLGVVPVPVGAALVGGGVLIAGIGWIDDHRPVSARWRALVHFSAASWALYCLGGLPRIGIGDADIGLGIGGALLAAVGIVWSTNLYNFMDGIDGIAAGQAVTAGLAGAVLAAGAGDRGIAASALLVAAASAGFLLWNWAPARIFMGDVGSGLLGFSFAVLAVASENRGGLPLLLWVLLLGVFVVDATVTLVRRIAAGQRWYEAHRSHAYQRMVQAGASHARVSLSVLALGVLLAVIAAAALLRPDLQVPGSIVGFVLLGALYAWIERRSPMPPAGTRGAPRSA
jgi:Fuc2NAc and GlcNAc transferase